MQILVHSADHRGGGEALSATVTTMLEEALAASAITSRALKRT